MFKMSDKPFYLHKTHTHTRVIKINFYLILFFLLQKSSFNNVVNIHHGHTNGNIGVVMQTNTLNNNNNSNPASINNSNNNNSKNKPANIVDVY